LGGKMVKKRIERAATDARIVEKNDGFVGHRGEGQGDQFRKT